MFWLDSFSRIDEMHGVVDSSWGLAETSHNQIHLALIEAAVPHGVDARYGGFLLLVDNDAVALEVQAHSFRVPTEDLKP